MILEALRGRGIKAEGLEVGLNSVVKALKRLTLGREATTDVKKDNLVEN
jgi:hypothetical protein